ncbi:hypothetical protein QYM36_015311, partial [Artemia franciscana]
MSNFLCCILVAFMIICPFAADAQYEDVRCKCVCPDTSVVNGTTSNRKLFIGNVPPTKCDCTNVVLPQVGQDIVGKEQEFCPRCQCRYESRNTTTIKVVVIIVIWIISLLVIYMLFLVCLDPLCLGKQRTTAYEEQTNEEVPLLHVINSHFWFWLLFFISLCFFVSGQAQT